MYILKLFARILGALMTQSSRRANTLAKRALVCANPLASVVNSFPSSYSHLWSSRAPDCARHCCLAGRAASHSLSQRERERESRTSNFVGGAGDPRASP